jgi:hypothetical protein
MYGEDVSSQRYHSRGARQFWRSTASRHRALRTFLVGLCALAMSACSPGEQLASAPTSSVTLAPTTAALDSLGLGPWLEKGSSYPGSTGARVNEVFNCVLYMFENDNARDRYLLFATSPKAEYRFGPGWVLADGGDGRCAAQVAEEFGGLTPSP